MSVEVVIGRRYAVVIPKTIRQRLKLREGQRALMRIEGRRILVDPLPDQPDAVLDEILGDFAYREEEHEARAEKWLKRVARARH